MYLGVLVVENGRARFDLGIQHVGVVNADEKLEIRLQRRLR